MKKIIKLSLIGIMMFALTGCCFSIGSLTIGKDCNKRTYCAATPVVSEFDSEINSNYSNAYKTAVKSVVAIVASTTRGGTSYTSTGSGITFKDDSSYVYIVTNKHVVTTNTSSYTEAHSKFEVTFHDYTKRSATLVGFAGNFDVAVVKVSKLGLTSGETYTMPTVVSAFSDVEIGNNVFTIGTPMSIQHAFSTSYGSVSNLFNTAVSTSANLGTYYPIQTDAAVNPGNSGGGMFNLDAELVGMVQGGRTSSSGDRVETTGINYAMPIDTVLNVANQLVNNGTVTFSSIGLPYSSLHAVKDIDDVSSIGLLSSEKEGIYLGSNPSHSSAAYVAGVRAGLIITSINDYKTDSMGLYEMLEKSLESGSTVTIKGHYRDAVSVEVTYQFVIG